MKASLGLLFLWSAAELVAGCSDSRNSDSTKAGISEHAGGHPSTHVSSAHEPGERADSSLVWVAAAANKVVISDQGSIPVRFTDTTIRVKGYGRVTWDQRRNRKVTVRSGGRVERLYVRYHYQYVRKGQKILELYTPEIATYAAEYLHHLQTPGDEALAVLSRKKLALLGVTTQQLRQLESTGRIPSRFPVYSNYGGYALTESSNNSLPEMSEEAMPAEGSMGDGMGGGYNPSKSAFNGVPGEMLLREGMYVNRGQTLFYVNDFALAWGVLSFDGSTQPFLEKGMPVVIKSELLQLPIRSVVAFIEPTFDGKGQKFMQVRVYLSNTDRRFKINSLIEGSIDIPLTHKMVIPATSVFSLGKRKVVWVKTGETPSGKHVFTAREIWVSWMDHKIAVVADGLSPAEEIAGYAGYLLDNQSLVEQ